MQTKTDFNSLLNLTKSHGIDFETLLDLPNLKQKLEDMTALVIANLTEAAGYDDAGETVAAEIKADPWWMLEELANGMRQQCTDVAH